MIFILDIYLNKKIQFKLKHKTFPIIKVKTARKRVHDEIYDSCKLHLTNDHPEEYEKHIDNLIEYYKFLTVIEESCSKIKQNLLFKFRKVKSNIFKITKFSIKIRY